MKPIILLARPRSGTTAFRELLQGHRQLAVLGEVFHNRYVDDGNYYYSYFLQSVTQTPSLALPSTDNVAALFRGYIDFVADKWGIADKPDKWFLLSVNYNSMHVLNTFWQDFHQPPHLIDVIRCSNYHVIHIIRRNLVQAALSELRAKRTGVWHLRAGEATPPAAAAKLIVPPAAFIAELRARKLEIELLETAFRGYGRCLTIEYESFYDEAGRVVPAMASRVEEFLELQAPIGRETSFRRTRSLNHGDWIENYDALAEALAGTEFAALLAA